MFLKVKANNDLVEVLSMRDLFDPYVSDIVGRYQRGEEVQDAEKFAKADLIFPSGEVLPQCWIDAHYREGEM